MFLFFRTSYLEIFLSFLSFNRNWKEKLFVLILKFFLFLNKCFSHWSYCWCVLKTPAVVWGFYGKTWGVSGERLQGMKKRGCRKRERRGRENEVSVIGNFLPRMQKTVPDVTEEISSTKPSSTPTPVLRGNSVLQAAYQNEKFFSSLPGRSDFHLICEAPLEREGESLWDYFHLPSW